MYNEEAAQKLEKELARVHNPDKEQREEHLVKQVNDLAKEMFGLEKPRLPWRLLVDATINYFERSKKETWTKAEICQRLNILHREFVNSRTRED